MIISSDCPTGPREILDNGKGGLLFKTGDVDDLVKKINFFTRNKKFQIEKLIMVSKDYIVLRKNLI